MAICAQLEAVVRAVTPAYDRAPSAAWPRRPGLRIVHLFLACLLVPRVGLGAENSVEVFDEVWRLTAEHFFDPGLRGVDWEAARERWRPRAELAASREELAVVVNGLLGELGTSHTRFLTPDDPVYYQLLDVFADGPLAAEIAALFPDGRVSYTGIGVFTHVLDGRHHVSGVLAGSPADAAGLVLGDAIVSVDGEPFHPIRSFAGRVGEELTLRVQTGPAPASIEERAVVPLRLEPRAAFLAALRQSARVHEVAGVPVAYARLWSWAGRHYQDELVSLLAAPPLCDARALVLDLRGGWGGAAPEYLSLFDRRVPVLEQIGRGNDARVWDARWRKPAVLLVDGETRSGKEVIAWGFRRAGIGPVVGARTAGAVTGGRPFLLADRSVLYLAVADVRVDGVRLESMGVEPDVEVPLELRWAAGHDPQLERALEVAAERAKARR